MTSGERMIWAAAYTLEIARIREADREFGKEDENAVSRAAEHACDCVENLRTARPTLAAGYADTSTLEMALEMLGKES